MMLNNDPAPITYAELEDLRDEFDLLRAENAELREALEMIAMRTAPGSRTMDGLIEDMMIACDHARAILAKTGKES